MSIIDHGDGLVLFGQLANSPEFRDGAIHRKTTVRRNHADTRALRLLEFRFQVSHVVMLVTKTLRLTKSDAVDDAGVIELIADDRVLLTQKSFEEPAIGVEGAWVKNGVLC